MKMNETTMKIDKPLRGTLKHMVRKDQTYSQVVRERIKCDAAGCDAAGINEIKVSAGKFGLFVCADCIDKFQEENKAVSPNHKARQQADDRTATNPEDQSGVSYSGG